MSTLTGGPRCRPCGSNEQNCAYHGGCCAACTHFTWLDAEGNEKPQQVGRPHNEGKCGTESGYSAHRYRHELPCQPCRDAHSAYNVDRARYRAGRAS